jgi:hypothetical protein
VSRLSSPLSLTESDSEVKRCTDCRETKPVGDYYWISTRKTRHAKCKPCYRQMVAGSGKKHRRLLRQEAIEAYGGRCVCCGETWSEFLVIDHVGGNGNGHRRLIGGTNLNAGEKTYRWLRQNGWPKGFQVLCSNCNMAKERGGCPSTHQEAK